MDEGNQARGIALAESQMAERKAYNDRQAQVEADNQRRIEEREQARQAEIDKEVKARREAEQKQAEAALRTELQAAYLGANKNATMDDFEAAYPRLRQEHMDREALRTGSTFDQDLAVARGRHRNIL
jgi:hypothetical protein